jgi:tRNA (guanine-N7-)-methyltransferase
MGKGNFIIEHARREPQVNFIGIEKYDGVIIQAVTKLENETLPNLRFISIDASTLLDIFDHGEISKLYLNFSDPWPKKKHAKRRLTHRNFLDKYEQILTGDIEFKTDNRELFEFSLLSFNENNYDFLDLSLDLHTRDEDIITTEYEDKFSAMGNPIYFVKVKKRGK